MCIYIYIYSFLSMRVLATITDTSELKNKEISKIVEICLE